MCIRPRRRAPAASRRTVTRFSSSIRWWKFARCETACWAGGHQFLRFRFGDVNPEQFLLDLIQCIDRGVGVGVLGRFDGAEVDLVFDQLAHGLIVLLWHHKAIFSVSNQHVVFRFQHKRLLSQHHNNNRRQAHAEARRSQRRAKAAFPPALSLISPRALRLCTSFLRNAPMPGVQKRAGSCVHGGEHSLPGVRISMAETLFPLQSSDIQIFYISGNSVKFLAILRQMTRNDTK